MNFPSFLPLVGITSAWASDPTRATVWMLIALFSSWYFTKSISSTNKKKKPYPSVPDRHWLVGNSLRSSKDPWYSLGIHNLIQKLEDWQLRYGSIPSNSTGLLEVCVVGQTVLVVCNNAVAEEVCLLRPNKIARDSSEREAVKSVGADGVFSAHGDIWRKDRRTMAPPLNLKNIRDYMPFLRTVTARLVQKWKTATTKASKDDNCVVVNQDVLSMTIDIIGLVAFDADFDSLRKDFSQEANDIKSMFQTMATRAMSPFRYWRIPVLGPMLDGSYWHMGRLQKRIGNIVKAFNDNNKTKDIIKQRSSTTYLEKILASSEQMSRHRLMGNLLTVFAAGSETTGNTIMIGIWQLIHNHRELLPDLIKEVQAIPSLETTATYDELLEGLPQLRAFFYEINRLHGTTPGLFLETSEPVKVAGITHPAGTSFFVPLRMLGMLPDSGIPDGPNGESPATFCSQRWLVQREEDNDNASNNVNTKWNVVKPSAKTGVKMSSGFGTGVRICPGQDLAELEVVYCLACLLKNFDMTIPPNHAPVQWITKFTMTPDQDIRVCLKPKL
mmetsp:Transcript_2397/g.3132  ORF Transcript_2397/g.3132 Transcript_2397/m.3132 type:complete len:555 (+) Transcript_2397:56-1720(+)